VGMLVLKRATILTYRSLKPSIEFGFRLLYQARVDLLKVVGNNLHIESWSWMVNSKLLHIFFTCSLRLVKPS
jgi:hypothetical protein